MYFLGKQKQTQNHRNIEREKQKKNKTHKHFPKTRNASLRRSEAILN